MPDQLKRGRGLIASAQATSGASLSARRHPDSRDREPGLAERDRRIDKAPAIDLPAVFFFVGVVLCGFGGAMLLPALVDLIDGNDDYRVFVTCSAIADVRRR